MKKILALSLLALLPGAPLSAAPFGYITNFNDGTVSVFDAETNSVIATLNVDLNPEGVAIHPEGTFAYVGNAFGPEEVKVIDTASNSIVTGIPVGNNPRGLIVHPQGTFIYVVTGGNDSVAVIDAQTNTVVGAPIPVGMGPQGIAILPDGSRLYVSNIGEDTVSVIDTASLMVVDTIGVGVEPTGMIVNPAGSRLYVANNTGGSISVIDTSSHAVITTIPVDPGPHSVAVHPNGQTLFVSHDSNMAPLTIIDAQSNTVISNVPNLGVECFGLSLHPSGAFLYVACSVPTGEVVVIDTASQTIVDRISVGGSPFAFGQFITPLGVAQLSSNNLDFGNQTLNTASAAQAVTLTNIGNLTLVISDISINGDFSFTEDCPPALAPSESCTLLVTYLPTTVGFLSGTLIIVTGDPDSPHAVQLTGVGVVNAISFSGSGCVLNPVASLPSPGWLWYFLVALSALIGARVRCL